jgi:hypothetical protein
MTQNRNPGAVAATGASKTFSSATERGEDSQPSLRFQAKSPRRAWWQVPALADIDDEDLRRQSAHLHRLGARSVYEFILEVVGGADPIDRLEAYSRLDPSVVRYLGGDRLPLVEGAIQ